MKRKIFNILSIDGGGIRGLYSASVIKQIERKYGPAAKGFDLICGTSTGGLIALGLALDKPANEIAEFYTERGPIIFPRAGRVSRTIGLLKQILFSSHSSKKLREEIVSMFGEEARMRDCKTHICIPAYNITKGSPIVFKSPHQYAKYVRDGDIPVVDVAMATTAAPTYFRNHYIDHENLPGTYCTDGGVWCNNPALAGLLEAKDHFVGEGKPFDEISILSISSAPKPTGKHRKGGGLLIWAGDLMGAAISGQSFFTDHYLSLLNNDPNSGVKYHRIEPEGLSISQQKLLEMDLASDQSLKQLARLGTDCGQHFVTQECEWLDSIFYSPSIV